MLSFIKDSKVLFSVLMLMTVTVVLAQPIDTTAVVEQPREREFLFTPDWNRFRASDSLTFLEFTGSINRSILDYVQVDDNYAGEFVVDAKLMEEDSLIARKMWRNKNYADSLNDVKSTQMLYFINSFQVPPGAYQLQIIVYDANDSTQTKSYTMDVKTGDFSKELAISDVQFATSIKRENSDNPYVKNGYKVMPNPSGVYGIGMPILYTYAEIYNLSDASSGEGETYSVSYTIYDGDGNETKSFPTREHNKPGQSAVEVNNLNVVTLVSGPYTLEVKVTDHETGKEAATRRRFFVYRDVDFEEGGAAFRKQSGVKTGEGSAGMDADRYDVMAEKELDQEFEYARYIAGGEERKTWKELNEEGKREYIKKFWAERDETPGTMANEFKQQYLSRVRIANQLYRGGFHEGWESDRGRILLVYGKPDEIERFPMSGEQLEYHVWHYYSIQGGVIFVFADKNNLGDLKLVHSTARGELYDPEWRRWINVND